MSEKHVLRIHTQYTPPESAGVPPKKWRFRHFAGAGTTASAHTVQRRHTIVPTRMGHTEKLLRNSAIACAVLLGILTLGNIDQPWSQKAAEGVEKALTMHIDLDDTIGELTFVRELMPESALVFLNISGKNTLAMPVDGRISHEWSDLQPWIMFDAIQNQSVFAVEDGIITAVSPLSDGQYGVLVDHGEGQESVYAYLSESLLQNGDKVTRGQALGTADNGIYFEWRINGISVDPTDLLGL